MKLLEEALGKYRNFAFIGEAGSGKSEIAVNYAIHLQRDCGRQVHFFDMDMTKPLFRSRDLRDRMAAFGIGFHYEEQFMDAPTLVGGVRRRLRDPGCDVVMDVGGDYIGARAIGGFARELSREDSLVGYVINPYRPWSMDLGHIDQVLGQVLGSSRIPFDKLMLISNPNIGHRTALRDVLEGHQRLDQMVGALQPLSFICVKEELYEEVKAASTLSVMPLRLYMDYPWDDGHEF